MERKPLVGLLGGSGAAQDACLRMLQPFAEVNALKDRDPPPEAPSFEVLLLILRAPYIEDIRIFAHYRVRQPALPVILLGAGLDANHAVELVKWGASDYLEWAPDRPLDAVCLRRKIERVLSQRVQMTLQSPILEALVGEQMEDMVANRAMQRDCFRVRPTLRNPASLVVQRPTAPGDRGCAHDIRLVVENLSIATETCRGGMLLRAEGPVLRQLPDGFRSVRAQFRGWVSLQQETAPTEVQIQVMRVEETSSSDHGTILWIGVQYVPVDPRQEERFRHYWVRCQRDRLVSE